MSKIFPALSVLSLLVAIAAIVISRPDEPAALLPSAPVPEVDSRELERRIARLNSELIALEGEVEALRAGRDFPGFPEGVRIVTDRDGNSFLADPDIPISAQIEAIIERRETEQRVAKLKSQSESMAQWVDTCLVALPGLTERIAGELGLPLRTQQEVEEILGTTLETMAALTDRLFSDPLPAESEAYGIMGEVKGAIGGMVAELDEILTADELIALGQVTVDSEMPRVGRAILEEGKNDHAAEDPEEGEGDGSP